ncbi:fatty-acid oxidation protein subunit alpha [Candidatus Magnetomorum sp. HK-1]|nr:fatty-acid oxidation protein subunit alpha [Candidatus Magnetomorum sp. HK-1]
MSAKDIYHDVVVQSLKKEKWKITHDPFTLSYGGKNLFVDIGAEKSFVAAQRDDQKVAIEIKSFISPSPINELEKAVGQFAIYRSLLTQIEPDRILYIAVPQRIYEDLLTDKFGQLIIESLDIKLIIFDPKGERSIKWL